MASRFWVGSTGTWDSTSTTHWAATTGGSSGASAPIAGDTITFDSSSGGGTVTVDSSIAGIAFNSFDMSAFTGTVDFSVNNPSVSFLRMITNGTSTRTLNMGSGTWTLTQISGTAADFSTMTNFTLNQGTSKIVVAPSSNPSNVVSFGLNAALTLNDVTVNFPSISGSTRRAAFQFFNAGTITTFAVTNAYEIQFGGGTTTTITNGLILNGGNSSQQLLIKSQSVNSVATLSVGGSVTGSYVAIQNVTKAGAGSITFTNSFDLGGNTGVTISLPAGSSGKFIGG